MAPTHRPSGFIGVFLGKGYHHHPMRLRGRNEDKGRLGERELILCLLVVVVAQQWMCSQYKTINDNGNLFILQIVLSITSQSV